MLYAVETLPPNAYPWYEGTPFSYLEVKHECSAF